MGVFSIKKRILIILLATGGAFASPVEAQNESSRQESVSPVDKIENGSNQRIKITIPDFILDLLVSDQDRDRKQTGPVIRPGVNRLNGFRIQVFSDGRSAHSLESRAKARGSAIASKYPKYRGQVYTFSSAPNWYTRVGNFQTQQEAVKALAELKRSFPQFASEMRIVRSQIVIVK